MMKILRAAALQALRFLSVFAIAWFSYDVRDFWIAHQPYTYTVAPGSLHWEPPVYNWDGSRSSLILADYFTPYGGLPPADGAGICSSGTSSTICNPITVTLTDNQTTPFSSTNASGTTTVPFSTTGTVNVTTVAANGVDGVTFATPSGTTPRSTVNLGGNAGTTAAIFFGGTPPFTFLSTPTSSTDVYTFDTSGGTCTNANQELKVSKAGAFNFEVTCNGNTKALGTLQYGNSPLTMNATATNEVDSNSTGATIPFELISINASLPTGDWFDLCTGTAGTCTNKELAVLNTGAVQDRPTINATSTVATLIPAYTVTVGGVASAAPGTYHKIYGACTFSASTTCDTSTQASGAVWSGSAVFNAAATTICVAVPTSTTGQFTYAVSTNKLVLTAASSNSATVPYSCWGP